MQNITKLQVNNYNNVQLLSYLTNYFDWKLCIQKQPSRNCFGDKLLYNKFNRSKCLGKLIVLMILLQSVIFESTDTLNLINFQ